MREDRVRIVELEPILVTVEEAGRLLGLGPSTVYELIAQKVVPAVRFSKRCTRVPVDALRERMNQLAKGSEEKGGTDAPTPSFGFEGDKPYAERFHTQARTYQGALHQPSERRSSPSRARLAHEPAGSGTREDGRRERRGQPRP